MAGRTSWRDIKPESPESEASEVEKLLHDLEAEATESRFASSRLIARHYAERLRAALRSDSPAAFASAVSVNEVATDSYAIDRISEAIHEVESDNPSMERVAHLLRTALRVRFKCDPRARRPVPVEEEAKDG